MQKVIQSVDPSRIVHYCRQLRNLGFVFDRVLETIENREQKKEWNAKNLTTQFISDLYSKFIDILLISHYCTM